MPARAGGAVNIEMSVKQRDFLHGNAFRLWPKYLFTYYILGIGPMALHMLAKHKPLYYTPILLFAFEAEFC